MLQYSDCLFTSESVTEGHPDKIADQISDGVLDAVLTEDPKGRVACETLVSAGICFVAGEITTTASLDVPKIARDAISRIGYRSPDDGFDARTCAVMTALNEQSPDIARGISGTNAGSASGPKKDLGAGDQGIMFGFACRETPEFMPLSIALAHRLTKRLAQVRQDKVLDFLRPDGKAQVTVEYRNGKVHRLQAVVISSQHHPDVSHAKLEEAIRSEVLSRVIPADLLDGKTQIWINPSGRFVLGGPAADCGLTGRKIIVDTYGGHGAHGGGAFSGKDPTKVDRSACYMARYIAKNIVAAGISDRCLVQLAYAIGVADPVSLTLIGSDGAPLDSSVEHAVRELFGLRPSQIIETLDLLRPIYQETSCYGHFGRTSAKGFTWERLDRVEALKSLRSFKSKTTKATFASTLGSSSSSYAAEGKH